MSLRLVNRLANAVKCNPSALVSCVSNPKIIIQYREMSKKDDGTCNKGKCGERSQFFGGCFTKEVRKPCVDKPQEKTSTCNNRCKSGPCKKGK